jgi:micrococcal nuclease
LIRRLPFGRRLLPLGGLGLAIGAAVATLAYAVQDHPTSSQSEGSPHSIRTIDGDTVEFDGERVRISNLDAPEMPGRARCAREAELALAAKAKLTTILSVRGARIELIRDTIRPKDRYGRTLGRITVDGVDVAEPLTAAGVARPWRGRSSDWCSP